MNSPNLTLTGVPETMLWTLHNRAVDALRPDRWIEDEHAVRIYRSIPYDYAKNFGTPDGSHAIRSVMFDEAVHQWLGNHPDGTVIELACGLETQFHRVDNGQVQWVCIDLPDALAVRERFLPPSERCRHIARSALDLSWMDEVASDRPAFISMQGLLMYFEEKDVKTLLIALLRHYPNCTVMFDTIPRWFSRKTLKGFWKTPHYKAPPMPWGVNRNEILPLLDAWGIEVHFFREEPFRKFRVFPWGLAPWIARTPLLKRHMPVVVQLQGAPGPSQP
jgi:O-methyltransferase involved in polyketide biosynthesis